MSDQIKHECGLALIRLKKPLAYYHEKYGTALYGIHKLQLLLQKQRNRGQDGAGLATIKLNPEPGTRYISRKRSNSPQYLKDLFQSVFDRFADVTPEQMNDPEWLKKNKPYTGEVLMGHLRYGTHGDNTIETCHPFLRQSNWISRNLVLAGNFNMTNNDELFQELVELGQYPKEHSDTVTVLEKIGHFLDDEVQRLFAWFRPDGHNNIEINDLICAHLDLKRLLTRACRKLDGGFTMVGMLGHGDAFVLRDPNGIRPAFYYEDDEAVVAASERPAIQTAFNVGFKDVKEIKPGHALIMKLDGRTSEVQYTEPGERRSCSFERIYFSRGTDKNIYLERKKLGLQLAKPVLESVNYDFENTVFSYIPNTAEVAFQGFIDGLQHEYNIIKSKKIADLGANATPEAIEAILQPQPRIEKLAVKDAKIRTFIAADNARGEMVNHVYDVTYGIVKNNIDTLVLLDDSIVRGTTLRDSIIRIIYRLHPKRIIIVSSAPQIRYPDCYGIDMSKMKEFVAFRALVELLKENGKENLLEETYFRCLNQLELKKEDMINEVQKLYAEFTQQEISKKIAQLVTPPEIDIPVDVIYQTIDGLHQACPRHTGDWYFSGNYPTPGGMKVVNKAYTLFMEKKNVRAY